MASTESVASVNTEVLYQQHGGSVIVAGTATEVLYIKGLDRLDVSSTLVEVLYQVPWPKRFGPRLQS
jgi:hypothetical protein